jgi:hypothetical protein
MMNANASLTFVPWLGAAGLSTAIMLGWGAAAAIPILLHFLNRRRQRPIPWAAMRLLMQVIEKEAKRMRIEQLLLLALRVLILLTLAVALARPYFTRDETNASTPSQRPPKLWIVALDTSYSMGYRSGGQSRFETAKLRAIELLEGAEPGDAFALIALSQPSRALIGTPTFDREGMLNELQRMSVQDTGSDLASGLDLIEEIARATTESERLPQYVHIFIESDLGRDAWQTVVDGPERSKLQALQNKYTVQVESLGEEGATNVSIKSIQPSTSRAIAGNSLNVEISLESAGANVERLPLQLELDGQTLATEFVDLAAGQTRSVRLQITPRTTGSSVLSASIPDDSLMADNRREHIIEVREQYRILIVEDQPNDARLLRLALRPAQGSLITPGIQTRSKLELGSLEPSNWDAIILNDLATVNQELAQKLERFARSGGSLVVMLGPRSNAEAWNNNVQRTTGLLGFELTNPSPESDWSIDPLDYRSPIAAPFSGFPDSGLLTTPIFRLWEIQPNKQQPLVIDLATTDGKPLIVRHRIGDGWIASVLSAPQDGLGGGQGSSPVWNAMASWPSFLPLMQQLVQTVLNTGVERKNVLAGEPLQGNVNDLVERARVTIIRPDRSENQISTEALDAGGSLAWIYGSTETRGIYRVQAAGVREQLFAVNINPIESSLDSLTPGQLPQADATKQSLDNMVVAPTPLEHDDQLARILLAALLALLVAESLLAWAMGRRVG